MRLLLVFFTLSSVANAFTPIAPSIRSTSNIKHDRSTRLHMTEPTVADLAGKTIYQRIFYRLSPASNIEISDPIVIEERTRFALQDPENGYVTPVGPRTMILRDGKVDEDEIGDEFASIVGVSESASSNNHKGAGIYDASVVTALYLASNPSLCKNTMLQVGSELGLSSLVGCLGAGFVEKQLGGSEDGSDSSNSNNAEGSMNIGEEILTIAPDRDDRLPRDLSLLTITHEDENEQIPLILDNIKAVGTKKILADKLDWTTRPLRTVTGRKPIKEYYTIVASDLAFSYPQAKELARTVANRLEPIYKYTYDNSSSKDIKYTTPRFVHVGPESRDDIVHLHRLLEKGYRMTVDTGYIKVEKIVFQLQTLPKTAESFEQECKQLDELELEVKEYKELQYQSLTAVHHPKYVGEGSGELFFPIETGEYDGTTAGTYLERDTGSGFGIM